MSSEDRQRQVATTKLNHGEDHYKNIGSKGGKNSPTKFDSTSASLAANKRWEKVKAAKLKLKKGTQDGQIEEKPTVGN